MEAGRDFPGEPAAEVIKKTQNHPHGIREGGMTPVAVWGLVGGVGGGRRSKKDETTGSGIFGPGSSGGGGLLPVLTPPPSAFQVLPSAQSGSEASGSGDIGWAESGADIQSLAGACRRREAIEGSLLLTERSALELSGAGGVEREGGITIAQTRVVGRIGALC